MSVSIKELMRDRTLQVGKKGRFTMTPIRWGLLFLGLLGLCFLIYRLINGLGASTNLSDEWPWGFWIFMDLSLSAVGASGFAIGILTHVFHLKQYYPLARRALLVSLLSYLLIFIILFVEIGRWDNFYMLFVSFAFSSPLYEVFICLTLYFIFQIVEVLEIWSEEYHPAKKFVLRFLMPAIVLIACVIPFGQEAALGAIYLGMPGKLDALWYSQFLPWGCLISAFFGGLCLIAVEYNLVSGRYKIKKDSQMIHSLFKIVGVMMSIYFVAKVIDLLVRGVFADAFANTLVSNLFLLEFLVGVGLPAVLCFTSLAAKKGGQVIIGCLGIFGIFMNRFNFIFTGMAAQADAFYFPSILEIGLVIGLACLMILAYLFLVENLPILQAKGSGKYARVSGGKSADDKAVTETPSRPSVTGDVPVDQSV